MPAGCLMASRPSSKADRHAPWEPSSSRHMQGLRRAPESPSAMSAQRETLHQAASPKQIPARNPSPKPPNKQSPLPGTVLRSQAEKGSSASTRGHPAASWDVPQHRSLHQGGDMAEQVLATGRRPLTSAHTESPPPPPRLQPSIFPSKGKLNPCHCCPISSTLPSYCSPLGISGASQKKPRPSQKKRAECPGSLLHLVTRWPAWPGPASFRPGTKVPNSYPMP